MRQNDPNSQSINTMCKYLLEPSDSQNTTLPYEKNILEKYPAIPSPECFVWNRTDENMARDPGRKAELQKAAAALEHAAQSLRNISDQTTAMTPQLLKACIKNIAGAIGHAETQLDMLCMEYPLHNKRERWQWYEEDVYLNERLPRILHKSKDSIILWLPRMPSISHINNSLVFTQMKDLLHMTELPHIRQWHCDFYHVFPESSTILGIRDVDNYPYKAVIDALARALHTSDRTFDFSIGMYNLLTNAIKPGCYIHITKRDEKVRKFRNFEEYVLSVTDSISP